MKNEKFWDEAKGLRDEASAVTQNPSRVIKRNAKMKKATKTKVWSCATGLLKAALTGIFTYLCAQFGGGCTTINFPADDARPTTFTGVTNFRVK